MGSILLLNKKLQESWIKDRINKKTGKIRKNANIEALARIGISEITEYYRLLIKKINSINSKYKVERIEFVDKPIPFINIQALNAGMIIKKENNGENIPLAYVFVSNPSLGSRNIFGAQQLFPGLSYLIKKFISAPFYELVNLPVYFINASTDNVTESMQETITAMSLMNVRYIQLFNEELLPDGVLSSNLIKYSRFISNDTLERPVGTIYTDFYMLDSIRKKLTFTTETFKIKNIASFGSSDRFFVIKAYPALILADEEMYEIDVSKIKSFLSIYGKGRSNLEPFIEFAEKLKGRGRV